MAREWKYSAIIDWCHFKLSSPRRWISTIITGLDQSRVCPVSLIRLFPGGQYIRLLLSANKRFSPSMKRRSMEVMLAAMYGVSSDGSPGGLRNSVTIVISNQSGRLRWVARKARLLKLALAVTLRNVVYYTIMWCRNTLSYMVVSNIVLSILVSVKLLNANRTPQRDDVLNTGFYRNCGQRDTPIAVVGGTRSEHVRAIEKSSSYCGKFRGIALQLMLPASHTIC